MEFGQLRSMLTAQSVASISRPMLIVVICWFMLIFLSFSLLAPPNPTATVALIASTLSAAFRAQQRARPPSRSRQKIDALLQQALD